MLSFTVQGSKREERVSHKSTLYVFTKDPRLLNDVDTADSNDHNTSECPGRPYNGAHVTKMIVRWFQKFALNMADSHPFYMA